MFTGERKGEREDMQDAHQHVSDMLKEFKEEQPESMCVHVQFTTLAWTRPFLHYATVTLMRRTLSFVDPACLTLLSLMVTVEPELLPTQLNTCIRTLSASSLGVLTTKIYYTDTLLLY